MTPMDPDLPVSVTREVRDRCLCLHVQRAARRLARRFDAALRPHGLTNGQFSLLMSLNRPHPPRLGELTPLLGMDRTTLTAAMKPLARAGLIVSLPDPEDRRATRLALTDEGRARLKAALPDWRAEQAAVEAALAGDDPAEAAEALRRALNAVR
jgi:DNA-binding MarR family transcriptional regulator